MVEMKDLKSPQLVTAVRAWTGWGRTMVPSRDNEQLVALLGDECAAQLLPLLKTLETDFYSSDARHVAADLQEMGTLASEDFRRKHPSIADEIVRAFAWCYTFDYK